jgi:hypothetical protein
VNRSQSQTQAVKPLLSQKQLSGILSARRSITSAEAYRQIAAHLGRPLSPGRKLTFVNGQKVWACC